MKSFFKQLSERFFRGLRRFLFLTERMIWKNKGGRNPHYHMQGCSRAEIRVYRCIFTMNRFLHLVDIGLLGLCIALMHVGVWSSLKQCCAVTCLLMIFAQIPCILLQKRNFHALNRAEEARLRHEQHLRQVLAERMAAAIPKDAPAALRQADASTVRYQLERFQSGKTVTIRPMDLHFLERLNHLLLSVDETLLTETKRSTPAELPHTSYRRKAEYLFGSRWRSEQNYGIIEIHDAACTRLWQQLAGKLSNEVLELALLSAEDAWTREPT